MIIPIRCFTCGKVLADKYDQFVIRSQQMEQEAAAQDKKDHSYEAFDRVSKNALLNEMGLTRYCCRRHMLGQVDMMDVI